MAVIGGQLRLQLGAGDGPGGQQQAAEGSLFAQLACKGQMYSRRNVFSQQVSFRFVSAVAFPAVLASAGFGYNFRS